MALTEVLKVREEHRTSELAAPFSSRERESILEELGHLLESHHFKPSQRCSSFLSFIVQETLEGNVESLKERILGVKHFKRDINYDTNADPVVRATAGEVRKRIAQHYQESKPGAIRISLPVGTYMPKFEIPEELVVTTATEARIETEKLLQAENANGHENVHLPSRSAADTRSNGHRALWIGLIATFGVALIAVMLSLAWKERTAPKPFQTAGTPAALTTFWKPFVDSQSDTVVVFGELKQHDWKPIAFPAMAHPEGISLGNVASPGLTGVGELMGMYALGEVFKNFHLNIRPKRGYFFTFDDAQAENLIFLGSPLTNRGLRQLQSTRDFVFQVVKPERGKVALAIINNRPKPGEPKQFLSTPETLPITNDYAVIALLPDMNIGKPILVLAGITTFGTQAAAEFVSREESLKSLVPQLKISKNGDIEPFEALISVTIKDEVPVHEQIVAVHQIGQ